MGFYDLSKAERIQKVEEIHGNILTELKKEKHTRTLQYFSDKDTYIRKAAYLSIGNIYAAKEVHGPTIISLLEQLIIHNESLVRQTAINASGEIGIKNFQSVEHLFDKGLFDNHPRVRNAVIGSVKKMGAKNPKSVLQWAKKYLHHPDKEVRREICHGIELRGRTHPEDILPILKQLQHDKTARVRNTLVHVLGQISYKKNCLTAVIAHLKTWDNKELVTEALEEIIDVHERYKNFAALTREEAHRYIQENF